MQTVFSKMISDNSYSFYPVVPFDSHVDKVVAINLSVRNEKLIPEVVSDIDLFSAFVEEHIKSADARYATGGYAEHRKIYDFSDLFDGADLEEEPRRLHLGIDIWSGAHTPVMAPLSAIIHSAAFNNQKGDYGGTIILQHQLGEITFFTLYGHLSRKSVEEAKEGMFLQGGQVFAETGISAENGGWPPHLHFQIILNLEGYTGDYPGVCKFSEKERWLANSPDGDLILGFNSRLASSG
jgi:peptidoglycan LD-endopeptidase LytH